MSRLLVPLCALLVPALASAVPVQLQHQGRIQDSTGQQLDGTYEVGVVLWDASSGGAELWSDAFATVEFTSGYYSLTLGSNTALELDAFDGDSVYMGISVDQGPEMAPRLPLTSVPFALRAAAVDGATLEDLSCGDGQFPLWDGSEWGCGSGSALVGSITSEPLALAAGSTLDGEPIVTGTAFSASDATTAMGDEADDNALNHARYTDGEAVAAVQATDLGYAAADHVHAGDDVVGWVNDPARTAALNLGALQPEAFTQGANLVPNAAFQAGDQMWSQYAGAGSVVEVDDGVGGHAWQNNSGAVSWVASDVRVPINPRRAYDVRGSFRRVGDDNSGAVYLGVRLWDKDGNEISGDGNWWYYPVSAQSASPEWSDARVSFGAGTARPFDTKGGAEARYMSVGAILNYDGQSSTHQVTDLGIVEHAWDGCASSGSQENYGFCIFHIGTYNKTYHQAAEACRDRGARLCSIDEVAAAQAAGAAWCSWGWTSSINYVGAGTDESTGTIGFPMQSRSNGCSNKIGVVTSTAGFNSQYGANCCR